MVVVPQYQMHQSYDTAPISHIVSKQRQVNICITYTVALYQHCIGSILGAYDTAPISILCANDYHKVLGQ